MTHLAQLVFDLVLMSLLLLKLKFKILHLLGVGGRWCRSRGRGTSDARRRGTRGRRGGEATGRRLLLLECLDLLLVVLVIRRHLASEGGREANLVSGSRCKSLQVVASRWE